MRRASLLPVVVALALAGCAGHTPVPGASPAAIAAEPLAVRLFQPSGRTITFALSRPAYIAVFEVAPGRGVSLLYPAEYHYAATHPSGAGVNVATLPPYNLGRMFYLASYADWQPTYLYAIASDTPLDIGEIMSRPSALRRRVGAVAFAQGFAQGLMDRLDEAVVPPQPDESWATDMLVLWPEPGTGSRRGTGAPALIYVYCADGRVIPVNAETGERYGECTEPRRVAPPPDSSARAPRPTTPTDSAGKRPSPSAPATPREMTPPTQRKSKRAPQPGADAASLVVDFRPAPPGSELPATSPRRRTDSHPGWRSAEQRASLDAREAERPADRARRSAERDVASHRAVRRDDEGSRSSARPASSDVTSRAGAERSDAPRSASGRQQQRQQ